MISPKVTARSRLRRVVSLREPTTAAMRACPSRPTLFKAAARGRTAPSRRFARSPRRSDNDHERVALATPSDTAGLCSPGPSSESRDPSADQVSRGKTLRALVPNATANAAANCSIAWQSVRQTNGQHLEACVCAHGAPRRGGSGTTLTTEPGEGPSAQLFQRNAPPGQGIEAGRYGTQGIRAGTSVVARQPGELSQQLVPRR